MQEIKPPVGYAPEDLKAVDHRACAIANADAHANNVGLPTYTELLDLVKDSERVLTEMRYSQVVALRLRTVEMVKRADPKPAPAEDPNEQCRLMARDQETGKEGCIRIGVRRSLQADLKVKLALGRDWWIEPVKRR